MFRNGFSLCLCWCETTFVKECAGVCTVVVFPCDLIVDKRVSVNEHEIKGCCGDPCDVALGTLYGQEHNRDVPVFEGRKLILQDGLPERIGDFSCFFHNFDLRFGSWT